MNIDAMIFYGGIVLTLGLVAFILLCTLLLKLHSAKVDRQLETDYGLDLDAYGQPLK